MINAYLRKIALAVCVVGAILLACIALYYFVRLLNELSPLISALATIAIALYTWALAADLPFTLALVACDAPGPQKQKIGLPEQGSARGLGYCASQSSLTGASAPTCQRVGSCCGRRYPLTAAAVPHP
jgi:hypothetical protein